MPIGLPVPRRHPIPGRTMSPSKPLSSLVLTIGAIACAEAPQSAAVAHPTQTAAAKDLTPPLHALLGRFTPDQVAIEDDETTGLRLFLLPQKRLSLSLVTPPDGVSIIEAARAADEPGRFDLIVNSPTYSYKDAFGQAVPTMPRSEVRVHGQSRFGAVVIGDPGPRRAWLGRPTPNSFLQAGFGALPPGVEGLGGPAPLILGGLPMGADQGRPNPELDAQRQRTGLGALTLVGLHPTHDAVLVLSLIAPGVSGANLAPLRDALLSAGFSDVLLLDPSISTFLVVDGVEIASATTRLTERQIPYGIHLSSPYLPASPVSR